MRDGGEIRQLFGPLVCDTPVPFYDAGVSCGLPSEWGDVPAEMMLVPGMLTGGGEVFLVRACGDSMEGVGIMSGDLLLMESTRRLESGNIVLAVVDGEQLLKTYYIDEEGRHWLVAANEKYAPLELHEGMEVFFRGRLLWHLRHPRVTTREIRQSLLRYRLEKFQGSSPEAPRVPTREEVSSALLAVAPVVRTGRQWLGACRVLMDCGFLRAGRYDQFCQLVVDVLPSHPHPPRAPELSRMAVEGFSRPFSEWTDERAPVHGQHYAGYHEVGEVMSEQLGVAIAPKKSPKLP